MTKTRRFVRFFSFFLTLTLVFVSFSTPAYAIGTQQFNAWIAAALAAANITISSIGIPIADAINTISEPPTWISSGPTYTYSVFDDEIDEYMNRSVIKIRPETVTIDGVEYQDIWLSHDAAEAFRVNSYDAITAWNIASESEGEFASGYGVVNGIPVYEYNNSIISQDYQLPRYTMGDMNIIMGEQYGDAWNITLSGPGYNTNSFGAKTLLIKKYTQGYYQVNTRYGGSLYPHGYITDTGYNIDETPFDFGWVSRVVPPNMPIDADDGMLIRVPIEQTNPIEDFIQDNPEFTDPNGVQINTELPDLMNKIDDLIDLIIPLIPIIDVEYNKYEETDPEPIPEPIPDPEPYPDPLPDPDISIIDSTLKDIIQALKNIFDNISIGNSIITAIKNLADQIKWNLDDIKESIGDLIDKIVKGNIDWFSDIIDSIKIPFLPWLNIFRLATNIWRYVTSWVAAITEPLTYFMQVMYDINPNLVKPFYAVAAAAIVIAIYKRFGQ